MLRRSLLSTIVVPLLLAAVSGAEPVSAQQTRPALTGVLDASVRTGKLPNGLTYYVRRNAEPATARSCGWW